MFRIVRSFWPAEPETKLKRRKGKNRKKRRNKANVPPNLVVENNLEDRLESLAENLIESEATQLIANGALDESQNQNFYEIEINEEQYQYMLATGCINENNECIRLEFPNKEDDPTIRNVLFEEQEELERKKKQKNDKWWMSDEEFDENYELTDEQKLKCAAFFIWIISLVVFFYFYNPEPSDKGGSRESPSNIDRIREMTNNRLPPGVLPHRNKFFPGMDDNPADHLSRYFDRNQRGRSPFDEPDFPSGHRSDDEELDEERAMRKQMRKRRAQAKVKKDGIKRILWWTEDSMPAAYRNKKIFDYYNCEKTNCEFLDDKSRLRESHAVVFDYNGRLNSSDMPSSRRKMQLYIFYAQDAPQVFDRTNAGVDDLKFNLSWSFTLDASIRLVAGNLIFDEKLINERNLKAQLKRQLSRSKIKDCLVVLANACKTIKLDDGSADLADLIETQKAESNGSATKDSSPNELNRNATVGNATDGPPVERGDKKERIESVLNLAQRLRIKPGHRGDVLTNYELRLLNELVESRNATDGLEFDLLTNCTLSNDELQSLLRNYRFVWIVENQSCKNHPNNHLYLALETPNTIPILNVKQQGDLPHNSVISLNEFGNVSNLVDYLQELKSDFTKFYSHLRWKRYFRVSYKRNDICDLCGKLNEINFKNYKDLTAEFTPNAWKLNAACFTYDKI